MKIFKISLTAILLSIFFIACKKEKNVEIPEMDPDAGNKSLVHGIWVGEYTTTTRTAPVYFSFRIKAGGALDLLNVNRETIGSGTWSLNDSKFKAEYIVDSSQFSYKVQGNFHAPEKLDGEWQYDMEYQDKGFWFMD